MTADPKPARGDPAAEAHLAPYSASLPLRLLRAREAVMARYRPFLRAHQVTEQQWRVLRTLSEGGEFEVMALADRVCLLPPSLSRILKDMAERGLVARRADAKDLRRNVVSITAEGEALLAEAAADSIAANQEIERLYGADRLARLKILLQELEDALATD